MWFKSTWHKLGMKNINWFNQGSDLYSHSLGMIFSTTACSHFIYKLYHQYCKFDLKPNALKHPYSSFTLSLTLPSGKYVQSKCLWVCKMKPEAWLSNVFEPPDLDWLSFALAAWAEPQQATAAAAAVTPKVNNNKSVFDQEGVARRLKLGSQLGDLSRIFPSISVPSAVVSQNHLRSCSQAHCCI